MPDTGADFDAMHDSLFLSPEYNMLEASDGSTPSRTDDEAARAEGSSRESLSVDVAAVAALQGQHRQQQQESPPNSDEVASSPPSGEGAYSTQQERFGFEPSPGSVPAPSSPSSALPSPPAGEVADLPNQGISEETPQMAQDINGESSESSDFGGALRRPGRHPNPKESPRKSGEEAEAEAEASSEARAGQDAGPSAGEHGNSVDASHASSAPPSSSSPPSGHGNGPNEAPLQPEEEARLERVMEAMPVKVVIQYLRRKGLWDPVGASGYAKSSSPKAGGTRTKKAEELLRQRSASTPEFRYAHRCQDCVKSFKRPCELKKHRKRHERPYWCTFHDCTKKFGSKNDWKRHENGQHCQVQVWRCDEKRASNNNNNGGSSSPSSSSSISSLLAPQCGREFHRRETFRSHLERDHGIGDVARLDDGLTRCQTQPGLCDGTVSFWCGFCARTVEDGLSWDDRYGHIDDHIYGRKGQLRRPMEEWKACPDSSSIFTLIPTRAASRKRPAALDAGSGGAGPVDHGSLYPQDKFWRCVRFLLLFCFLNCLGKLLMYARKKKKKKKTV